MQISQLYVYATCYYPCKDRFLKLIISMIKTDYVNCQIKIIMLTVIISVIYIRMWDDTYLLLFNEDFITKVSKLNTLLTNIYIYIYTC